MTYNLSNPEQTQAAAEYFQKLYDKGAVIELKEKRKRKKSPPQFRYLHLVFHWVSMETGYSAEEVKQDLFKRFVNVEIFVIKKDGIPFCRSVSDLDTKEMTMAIERFRNYMSKEAGIYIPAPNEVQQLESIQEMIMKSENYVYL